MWTWWHHVRQCDEAREERPRDRVGNCQQQGCARGGGAWGQLWGAVWGGARGAAKTA